MMFSNRPSPSQPFRERTMEHQNVRTQGFGKHPTFCKPVLGPATAAISAICTFQRSRRPILCRPWTSCVHRPANTSAVSASNPPRRFKTDGGLDGRCDGGFIVAVVFEAPDGSRPSGKGPAMRWQMDVMYAGRRGSSVPSPASASTFVPTSNRTTDCDGLSRVKTTSAVEPSRYPRPSCKTLSWPPIGIALLVAFPAKHSPKGFVPSSRPCLNA